MKFIKGLLVASLVALLAFTCGFMLFKTVDEWSTPVPGISPK